MDEDFGVNQAKSMIRALLPPVMFRWLKALRPRLSYAPAAWETPVPEASFSGWNLDSVATQEQAKWDAFCRYLDGPGPLGFSHEDTDIRDTRNVDFHNIHMTYGYVLAVAAWMKAEISVLDWGGGLGHYQRIGRALLPDVGLNYHCCEVPALARAGKLLNPEITWHTGEQCLEATYDLVMINGSLQYMRDWRNALQRLARAASGYLFLTRVPVIARGPSFVAVQRAYGTVMLHQQLPQREILDSVQELGFTTFREFAAGEAPYIRGAPEPCEMRGWLFRAPKGGIRK